MSSEPDSTQKAAKGRVEPVPGLPEFTHCGRGGAPAPCRFCRVPPFSLPHPLTTDLEALARQVAEPAGLSVVGIQLHTHRIPMTVQVLLRRADGGDVTLDTCAAISGPLGEAFDTCTLLDSAYTLEVSSPGIGDELESDRDFISFRGFPVAVSREAADGRRSEQEGLLIDRDTASVRLNVRGRTLRIPRAEVRQVRLISPRDGP